MRWSGILTAHIDPYLYPGTSVLRNLRNIRDASPLNKFEADATARRLRQLEHRPLAGRFDPPHLQAIHHYIFQDVFDWAGELRTVNISKSGTPFALKDHIVSTLSKTFDDLNREGNLVGADRASFARRGACYLGEINAIHPFREGNGRAQREFITALALNNHLIVDWTQVSREKMIEASRRSLRVDSAGLEEIMRSVLEATR